MGDPRWTVGHGVVPDRLAYSDGADVWLAWDDLPAPADVPDSVRRAAFDGLVAKVRDAARVPELQAELDARAADLGRFTQSAVAKTKELEAKLLAAQAVIREIIDDDCSYEQGTATRLWTDTEAETIRQSCR